MAISTTAQLNSLYNSIYEDALFVARETTLMVGLVRTFSGTGYATRTIPVFSQSTAVSVAEGVDYANPQTFSKTSKATLTPGEVMAQYLLTDRMIATDDEDNVRSAAAMELGMSIAEKVDEDLLGKFSSFDTQIGSAGAALTISKLAAANAILNAGKARGVRHCVLHPYGWHDIWTELGQPAATYDFLGEVANQALRDHFVGNWMGMNFYQTSNISIDANDDANGGMFVDWALGFDVREPFSVRPERDESLRATELNAHMGYATAVIRSEWGVYLTHDATQPTS